MSAPVNARQRIMPPSERERLKLELESQERDMKGDFPEVTRGMKKFMIDRPGEGKSLVNQNVLNRMRLALKLGEVPPLSRTEIIRLEKEEKLLIEWCRERMTPLEDTRLMPSIGGTTNPEFSRAVNFMAKGEHSQEFLAKAHRLKNIRRMLRKDDEIAGNLEVIRPKRGEVNHKI